MFKVIPLIEHDKHNFLEYPKVLSSVTIIVNAGAIVITTSVPVKVPGKVEHESTSVQTDFSSAQKL